MSSEKIEQLIVHLNSYLEMDGSKSSVSPTSPPAAMGEQSVAASLYLKKHMGFSSLAKNELLLAHCLLHKFYSTGNNKLRKEDLRELHKEILPYVEQHMEHTRFDKLDD